MNSKRPPQARHKATRAARQATRGAQGALRPQHAPPSDDNTLPVGPRPPAVPVRGAWRQVWSQRRSQRWWQRRQQQQPAEYEQHTPAFGHPCVCGTHHRHTSHRKRGPLPRAHLVSPRSNLPSSSSSGLRLVGAPRARAVPAGRATRGIGGRMLGRERGLGGGSRARGGRACPAQSRRQRPSAVARVHAHAHASGRSGGGCARSEQLLSPALGWWRWGQQE